MVQAYLLKLKFRRHSASAEETVVERLLCGRRCSHSCKLYVHETLTVLINSDMLDWTKFSAFVLCFCLNILVPIVMFLPSMCVRRHV